MKKRMLPILIAGCLLLLFSAGTVSAASQRVFPDVQIGNWAEKDLAEMKAKGFVAGYADGYRPNEKVTREQVVAMLLRVVGMGGSKPQQSLDEHNKNNPILWHKNVSPWAKEAIAVAWEKGIIPQEDLKNFRPTHPVTRHELAVFAVRAMGLTEEAKGKSGSGLTFSDAGDIPSASKGFVEVALEKKIFTGYADNTFRPNDLFTRLHIAAVLARIDNLVGKNHENTVKGQVVVGPDISGTMAIKDSTGAEKVYTLSSKAFIYDGRNSAIEQLPPSALMAGHQVELVLDKDGLVVYAEIMSESGSDPASVGSQVKGFIAFTPDPSGRSLNIIHDGDEDTYPVKADASIKVNGNTTSFSKLSGGQEVTATIQDGQIAVIVAKDARLEIKGTIKAVTSSLITVETKDGLGYQFSIIPDTDIQVQGKDKEVDDLVVGQEVQVTANNLTAVKISAQNTNERIEGVISQLTFSPKWTMTVTSNGSKRTFNVDIKCDVERDNKDVTFVDLVVGDEVELIVKNNLVTDIEAESEETEVEGTVKKIAIERQTYITIEDEDGEEYTYEIPKDARIRKDGKAIDLQQVKAGDFVELDIEGSRVTKMVVEGRINLEYFTGKIEDINFRTDVIVITSDKDETVLIDISENPMVVKFGKEIDLDDLDEGDVITVTGKMKGNMVEATGIMVVSAAE